MVTAKKPQGAVPKLRFPGFEGEWDQVVLGNVLTLQYGASLAADSRQTGDVPVIGSNGIVGYHDTPLISGPAIVVGRKGSAGSVTWIDADCFPIDTTFYVEVNDRNEYKLSFLKLVLDNRKLDRLVDRGGVPGLSRGVVYSEYAAIPRPAEQQKIADCLSSLDACIGAETRKLDALKAHKQSLMQQLFPAEGQRLPRLRFPGFKGDWEIKEVGDIFSVTRGEVLSMTLVSDEKTPDTLYPVYSSQTKKNGLAGYYSAYLYENAITWTTDGANAGDVNYRAGKFYCTNVCGVLINNDGYANPCLAALIGSVAKKHVSYVGNPKLMNGVMAKINIPIPSFEEQQKIVGCLSSFDRLIDVQFQKICMLQQHKKGLMQGLFPATHCPTTED